MVKLPEAVALAESCTCAVKTYVPAVVGVLEIAPVAVFSVNPGGKVPAAEAMLQV
jgi:hypothetical protein